MWWRSEVCLSSVLLHVQMPSWGRVRVRAQNSLRYGLRTTFLTALAPALSNLTK